MVFIQVVRGLRALHELKIMHRDLKSANVFLYKDAQAKLGDMNVSKVAKRGLSYTQTGTPYYASPEVWRDQPYDVKSDVWSLGCVIYEMITLKPPFRAEDMASLYKKVLKGVYPKIPSHFSQDLSNIIRQMLQVSAHLRPTCDKLLRMPGITKRIEKFFPGENFDQDIQNILLQTIRIPRNLLYLTDRLPKPKYELAAESQDSKSLENRRKTSDMAYKLPAIIGKGQIGKVVKKPKYAYMARIKNLDEELAEQLPPTKKSPAKESNKYTNRGIIKRKSSGGPSVLGPSPGASNLLDEEKRGIIDQIYANSKKKKRRMAPIRGEDSINEGSVVGGRGSGVGKGIAKQHVGSMLSNGSHKYLANPNKYDYKDDFEDYQPEQHINPHPNDSIDHHGPGSNIGYSPLNDYYINQLVNKKNPVLNKGQYYNMHRIANIYGHNQPHSIRKKATGLISEIGRKEELYKLPKINQKMVISPYAYNFSPYIQGSHLKGLKVNKPGISGGVLGAGVGLGAQHSMIEGNQVPTRPLPYSYSPTRAPRGVVPILPIDNNPSKSGVKVVGIKPAVLKNQALGGKGVYGGNMGMKNKLIIGKDTPPLKDGHIVSGGSSSGTGGTDMY